MTRTRSLQVLIFAALLVLPASTASSYSLSLRLVAPELTSFTVSSNIAYVTVSNLAKTSQSCRVSVQAVVDGETVTTTATQIVAAGATATIPITLPDPPSDIIGVGVIADGPAPI